MKTQFQIPDMLFREAKRLAAENEMSFAEVVRRGLEEIIRQYPPGRTRAEARPMPKIDFAGRLKRIWGDRVFSDQEVAEMRMAELDGEEE